MRVYPPFIIQTFQILVCIISQIGIVGRIYSMEIQDDFWTSIDSLSLNIIMDKPFRLRKDANRVLLVDPIKALIGHYHTSSVLFPPSTSSNAFNNPPNPRFCTTTPPGTSTTKPFFGAGNQGSKLVAFLKLCISLIGSIGMVGSRGTLLSEACLIREVKREIWRGQDGWAAMTHKQNGQLNNFF